MLKFLAAHQLDAMQALSGICGAMAFLLVITKALTKKRRLVLIHMELVAMFLLIFDRAAYVYSGQVGQIAYVMVRLSNFFVFFLTSEIVLAFNMYLTNLLTEEGGMEQPPKRLKVVYFLAAIGMIIVIVSQFTGLIYIIDEFNKYHRSPTFLISYVIPIVGPIIQLSVIIQYREKFSKIIYTSLWIYLLGPIIAAIIQIFAYGLSITNMAMVLVSVFLYIFAYLDINESIKRAHEIEMHNLIEEQKSAKRLFNQTATAFVTAIDAKDAYGKGHSVRVANYARKIAEDVGKPEEECEEVYYAALLHDVGTIGIPDSVIGKEERLDEKEYEIVKAKPVIGGEILSGITEYPYLKLGAQYCQERYDGTGYPDGLKGDEIPEVARIIAVADAYDTMMSKKSFRDPIPEPMVREEFVKESGVQFDPVFTETMLKIMAVDERAIENRAPYEEIEKELHCEQYRGSILRGIPISRDEIKITFRVKPFSTSMDDFSEASIILFDSFDARVHDNEKAIKSYRYLEYGELWFDGHVICTAARNMKTVVENSNRKKDPNEAEEGVLYEIIAGKYEDHLKLGMCDGNKHMSVTVALVDSTKAAYIGLTGEHCHITDIEVNPTGKVMDVDDIERIADEISYIDRMESDVPNIQVDRTRSGYTAGIPVKDRMRIIFHSLTLPSANLVWHCPYILFFTSDDGLVDGKNYHEYTCFKINGEPGDDCGGNNHFVMKKGEEFGNWDDWLSKNKEGIECEVKFTRKGNKIVATTENLGIHIQNSLTFEHDDKEIYVALTGDQVALTDIRII